MTDNFIKRGLARSSKPLLPSFPHPGTARRLSRKQFSNSGSGELAVSSSRIGQRGPGEAGHGMLAASDAKAAAANFGNRGNIAGRERVEQALGKCLQQNGRGGRPGGSGSAAAGTARHGRLYQAVKSGLRAKVSGRCPAKSRPAALPGLSIGKGACGTGWTPFTGLSWCPRLARRASVPAAGADISAASRGTANTRGPA
jgi:hypothetical protein